MPFTPKELEVLAAFSTPSEPAPTTAGIGEIAGRDLANLIPNAGNSLARSLSALADPRLSKEEIGQISPIPQFVNPPEMDGTATMGQGIAHTVLGGIAPEVAAALVPYLGVSKLAKVAGAGEVMSTVLGNVGQGAFSGAQYGNDEAGRMAAIGGASSAVGALPWVARIPAALAVAGTDYAMLHSNPETAGMATTAAAVDTLASLIGYRGTRQPIYAGPKLADEAAHAVKRTDIPPVGGLDTATPASYAEGDVFANVPKVSETGLKLKRDSGTRPVVPTPGGIPASTELLDALQGNASTTGLRLADGPIPNPADVFGDAVNLSRIQAADTGGLQRELVSREVATLQSPLNPTALTEALQAAPIVRPGEAVPRPDIVLTNPIPSSGPLAIEPRAGAVRTSEFHDALNVDPAEVTKQQMTLGKKGKVHTLPEYMRTSGGGVQREIFAPIVGAGVGGAVGYQEGGVPGAIGGVVAGGLAGFGLSRALEAKNLLPHARERGSLDIDPPEKIVESGIVPDKIKEFHQGFQEKIKAKAEEGMKQMVPTGMKKGATFYSKSGRQYEFLGDGAPAKSSDPKYQGPRVYYRDPFTGAEGTMMHWGIDWEKTGIPEPKASREEVQNQFKTGKIASLQSPKPTDTPEFKEWFGKSVVADETGAPSVQYHGSQARTEFNSFRLLSHFGTNDAAEMRIGYDKAAATIEDLSSPRNKRRTYPVYLKIEKPLEIADDGIDHNAYNISLELQRKGILTEAERQLVHTHKTDPEQVLINLLKDKGYDGFKYTNALEDRGKVSWIPFEPNQIKSATGNSGAFSKLNPDIRGEVSRELVLPLAGATVGGLIGEKKKGVEGAIAGAIIGGTGGIIGAKILDSIERISPKLKATNKDVVETAKLQSKGAFDGVKQAVNRPWKDLSGQDVMGRGGILSKTIRIMEDQFRLFMPDNLKTIITQARGFASEIVDNSSRALKSVMRLEPDAEIKAVVNKFLNGELIDIPAEIQWLKGKGAITKEEFNKLLRTEREEYTKWTTRQIDQAAEDAKFKSTGKVTKPGDEEHVSYYVKGDVKEQFLSLQEEQFLNGLPEQWKHYGEQLATARRGMNEFQKLLGDALPDGKLRNQILDSVGRYVPRMYRIFTDPKYRPTDEQIQAAMQEFGFNKVSAEIAQALEVKKGMATPEYMERIASLQKSGSPDAQIHLERLERYKEVQHNGRTYNVSPEIAESLTKYSNEDYLKKEIENYLQEIAANRSAMKGGKGLDKTMFMERENISPTFRDMLGEYTDPVERMAIGLQKMYAPSQAARLMSMAREINIDGLPASMSDDVWAKTNRELRQAIDESKRANDNSTIATLQDRLEKLNAYGKLPNDIKFGDFSGLYVNRFVKDYFNEDWKVWENSVGRHMASLNNFFKTTHIPLNPVTQLRQWVSMPFFALIGKASPAAIGQALSAYRNLTPAVRKELLQQGIWTADFIRGELKGSVDTILNGRYDTALVRGGRETYEAILEAYRLPDMLIRGGTYISAKNRIAKELGKALDDPAVIQKAVEWTDRYTMNYDNISKFVRGIRNVPLVNPFISFQAEILRIVKNMVVDGTTKNPERLATLGGILAFPSMMMMAGESALSPEDKKAWQKTKSQLPEYLRYQALVPISKLANGNFKYVSLSSIIPQDNLDQSVQAMVKGDPAGLATVNPFFSSDKSPLFNAISELVTGEDKETGLAYRNNTERVADIVGEFLPPLAPGGYEWSKLANVNVENLKSGRKQDWGDIALRYITGLTAGSVNPSTTAKAGASQLRRDIANLRQYYIRVAQTTAPDETKHREYDKYRQGVEHLLTEYVSRYGQ